MLFRSETDIAVRGIGEPFHAVFIRAPRVTRTGEEVEVLAEHDGVAALVRSKTVMAASFHPELTDDDRVHAMFLELVTGAVGKSAARGAR